MGSGLTVVDRFTSAGYSPVLQTEAIGSMSPGEVSCFIRDQRIVIENYIKYLESLRRQGPDVLVGETGKTSTECLAQMKRFLRMNPGLDPQMSVLRTVDTVKCMSVTTKGGSGYATLLTGKDACGGSCLCIVGTAHVLGKKVAIDVEGHTVELSLTSVDENSDIGTYGALIYGRMNAPDVYGVCAEPSAGPAALLIGNQEFEVEVSCMGTILDPSSHFVTSEHLLDGTCGCPILNAKRKTVVHCFASVRPSEERAPKRASGQTLWRPSEILD